MLEEEEYPDVAGAYRQIYEQVEEKEPNLDDAQSRQEYVAALMDERDEGDGLWTLKGQVANTEEEAA